MNLTTNFGYASVNQSINLQWVFMVEWVIALFGSIGILFYFNRLIGSLISFILKYVLWNRYKVRLKVQSYKVSFLGGRIFFKDVTIITRNEMVLIHQGWLTWRYWLASVRRSGFIQEQKNPKNSELPTRLLVEIYGCEVFMFNRMGVYEELLSKLNKDQNTKEDQLDNFERSTEMSSDRQTLEDDENKNTQKPIPNFIKLLPLKIHIKQGSLVIGNETTTSLLVGSYTSLDCLFDFLQPASSLDALRIDHDIRAYQLQLFLRPNISFKSIDQLAHEFEHKDNSVIADFFHKLGIRHRKLNESQSADKEKSRPDWHGLERYMTSTTLDTIENDSKSASENKDETLVFAPSEYARYSHILDSEYVDIHYYYDTPGEMSALQSSKIEEKSSTCVQQKTAPANNVDISISKGVIHYGPWADKERVLLHQMLFPSLCRDEKPQKPDPFGSKRTYTGFWMYIQTIDELVIRVPFRESSKDVLYANNEHVSNQLERRPFGWIEVKLGQDSVFNSSTSYIPSADSGWDNQFHLDLRNPSISSSVNHHVFFKAMKHTVDAEVGYPLQWNGAAKWIFNNQSTNAELYFLREHIDLLTDMFGDFSSGEPTPYELFRPFFYVINWNVHNYNIYLNLNEKNIVSHPLDYNDNIYISFAGTELDLTVDIPMESIMSKITTFNYKLNTTFDLVVHLPPWHTGHNFLKTKEVGRANNFEMSGSFTYYNLVEIDTVDTIVVNCTCEDTTLQCYGFIIRYVLLLKANYFGEDVNFQTLNEFLDEINDKTEDKHEDYEFKPYAMRLRNETDLLFSFCVKNGCLVLPSHIYDCESHIALHFDTLDIDLRFNNYYMDLQANFSEVYGHSVDNADERVINDLTAIKEDFKPQIFIDHLPIHGHRAFGLPPDEPTYYCRWSFHPGEIIVDSEPSFLDFLKRSMGVLGVGYNDLENALDLPIEDLFDILNLTFSCPVVQIKLNTPSSLLKLKLESLFLTISDQSTNSYNSRINFKIGDISAISTRNNETVLDLNTSLYLTDFVRKPDFSIRRETQKAHLQAHDAPFHRCPFLVDSEDRLGEYRQNYGCMRQFINLPDIPAPLNLDAADLLINSFPKRLREYFKSRQNFSNTSITSSEFRSRSYNNVHNSGINDDDGFENDNIVCTFGAVDGFINPEVSLVLADVLSVLEVFSVTNILDEIQGDFISHLMKTHNTINQKIKVKAVIPVVNVKVASSRSSANYIGVKLLHPTLGAHVQEQEFSTMSLEVLRSSVSLVSKKRSVCHLDLTNLKTDFSKEKSSVSVVANGENLQIDFDLMDYDWIDRFVSGLMSPLEEAVDLIKKCTTLKNKAKIDVIYSITKAGIDYSVRHDPSCITKPSYISKFSDEHIRREDSWKIFTRIRHIAHNLPREWHQSIQTRFDLGDFSAPPDAKQKVFDAFLNWRRWEFSNISTSHVLRNVFGDDQVSKTPDSVYLKAKLLTTKLNILPFNNLAIIKNIDLAFDKGESNDDLRQSTEELSGHAIDNQMNATISASSFNTNLHCTKNSISYINELLMNMVSKRNLVRDHVAVESLSKPVPTTFSVNVLVREFKHLIAIDRTAIDIRGNNSALSLSGLRTDCDIHSTLLLNNSTTSIDLLLDKMKLIQFRSLENSLVAANTGGSKGKQLYFDLSTTSASLSAVAGSDTYLKALSIFSEEEYPMLKPLIDNLSSLQTVDTSSQNQLVSRDSEILEDLIGKLIANVYVSKLSVHLGVLSPLLIRMDMQDIAFDTTKSKLGMATNFTMSRMNVNFFSTSTLHQILMGVVTVGNLRLLINSMKKDKELNVLTELHADHLKVNTSQHNILYLAKLGESDMLIIQDYSTKFKEAFSCLSSKISPQSPSAVSPEAKGDVLKYCINLTLDGLSFVCLLNNNQTYLDSSKIAMKFVSSDFNHSNNKTQTVVKIPSTKIIMLSHGRQTSKHTLGDFNIELRGTVSIFSERRLYELELISDHCRLAFSPYYANEVINFYADFQKKFNSYKFPNESAPHNNVNAEEIWDLLSVYSIQIVSRNLCIGWLLPEITRGYAGSDSDIPGFIIGYENAEVHCSTKMGNVLVSGMYLATAHGSQSTNFYSVSDESLSENRAFFPRFELDYKVLHTKEGRDIKAKLQGDEVDFKLKTTIFTVSERLAHSIILVQEKLETLNSHQVTQTENPDGSHTFLSSFHSDLRSLGCIFTFNGASIMVIHPGTDQGGKSTSLALQAPSIQIAADYIKCRDALKKHVITLQAITSRTDNVLSSSSVPVIVSLVNSVRSFVKKSELRKAKMQLPKTLPDKSKSTSVEADHVGVSLERVFDSFELNLSLKVEPQRLTLSCEPNAKVEAAVSTSGIYWHFNTDTDVICTSLCIEQLKVELQHIYSKETSGSVGINNIMLSATVGKTNDMKIMSTIAKISNIDAYLNIQQRQDLDIFVDIWIPSDLYKTSVREQAPVPEEMAFLNIATKVRDVSNSTALPWILTLIVGKLNLKVDLGFSLGTLIIDADKCWIKSTKISNRDQNLRVELGRLDITSQGRLGGMLHVEKARIATGISWTKEAGMDGIPLVLLSAGFKSLETKISLDYHTFCIATITKAVASIHNQSVGDHSDKLSSRTSIESCNVYMTALMASNLVDIYTIGLRIRQDIKVSYHQTLNDAVVDQRRLFPRSNDESVTSIRLPATKKSEQASRSVSRGEEFLKDTVDEFYTELDVSIGSMQVQVFPSSLVDTQALVIRVGMSRAKFEQIKNNIIENRLDMKLDNLTVSLSTFRSKPTEASLDDVSVQNFVELANTANGGGIFVFPSLSVDMDVFQSSGSNHIDFRFKSSFGGNVDVRWKLGSVYFIREMWYSHASALKTRLTALRIFTSGYDTDIDELLEENYKESIFEAVNLEDKLKDVEADQIYEYTPLEEPLIETPKLRDLGNATPPLEWFGLHRNKFPNLTHQFVIVGLQKLVKEAENRYANVLK
uniref:Cold sensitive for fermentation protein n=1 Tax=Ogataea thermomethanolica (nom. inval.) TaxID=310468 RepID=A0A7R6ZTB7_9ASCO|nr:cold sensitive for fermentation protein [Ogataea thermomethanolica (nom. inval.)]